MPDLYLYNSMSRKKEIFEPVVPGHVGIYVCGPTVYGDAHLGHAKSYISFDVVVRFLRYLGFKVRYVQNITDVGHLTDDGDQGEDKLAKQARIEQLEPMEVAEKYTNSYFRDMDALGVERPSITPHASGHIPEQIAMIKKLIENGHAYEVNGNVYFDVNSDSGYGQLSGRKLDDAVEGTRVSAAGDKRNAADFALWKSSDGSHLMEWDSPWGMGYPGWHIECSAMSIKYLGENFDIHGGGLENQFPHHECEIAQARCANHTGFAKYWMHNNMVTLNGQKMGKSLGNAISLHQFYSGDHKLLTRAWSPQTIRCFLLQSHYRSTTDFSEKALEAAETGFQSLSKMMRRILETTPGKGKPVDVEALKKRIIEPMLDDFNTAKTIGNLFIEFRELGKTLSPQAPENLDQVHTFIEDFVGAVLGMMTKQEEQKLESDLKPTLDALIQALVQLRSKARAQRNFQLADEIRDKITQAGISLQDGTDGTTYTITKK